MPSRFGTYPTIVERCREREKMTFDQDPEIASELRRTVGREWSEEAAEDERLTAAYDRRRFGMSLVAKEMVNRGDRVTVIFGGQDFSGQVVGGGVDHVTIEGSGQRADVLLDAGYWSILPAGGGGGGGTATEESIKARLAEYADSGVTVRLVLSGGEIVIGHVSVVASDHVELVDADDRTLYVPAGIILAIVRASSIQ
jgi:hypothetical protein